MSLPNNSNGGTRESSFSVGFSHIEHPAIGVSPFLAPPNFLPTLTKYMKGVPRHPEICQGHSQSTLRFAEYSITLGCDFSFSILVVHESPHPLDMVESGTVLTVASCYPRKLALGENNSCGQLPEVK